MTPVMGLIFLFTAVFAFVTGVLCVKGIRLIRTPDNSVQRIEYIEYATPDHIADIWTNYNRTGECKRCGGDDAPLMVNAFVCKWCAEASALMDHIIAETRRIGRPLVGPKKSYGQVFLDEVLTDACDCSDCNAYGAH